MKSLEINWAVGLCEIARPMLTDGLPSSWHKAGLDVSVTATALNAMQGFMIEYDTFNMFHRDREAIQEEFTDLLLEQSLIQANHIHDTHPMNDDARCSLMQSFMKNGGKIMSSLWNSYGRKSVKFFQENATDQQKNYFRKNGFPLGDIKTAFESQMENMAAVSLKSMDVTAVNFELQQSSRENQTSSLSMSL